MGLWTVIRRSLRYYLRGNLAVGVGVAVAVAVLVGSLMVGDSVTGSLRQLALQQLGRVEFALTGGRFFNERLALDVQTGVGPESEIVCTPLIVTTGAARVPTSKVSIGRLNVLGVTERFWELLATSAPVELGPGEVVINRSLADDLSIRAGQDIVISFGRTGRSPMHTVFGRSRRRDVLGTTRVTVRSIIPDKGAGVFSLRAGQVRPRNLYMSLRRMQKLLKQPGRINSILVSHASEAPTVTVSTLQAALADAIRLDDYALLIRHSKAQKRAFMLTSRQLVLAPEIVASAKRAARNGRFDLRISSVYLANSLKKVDADAQNSIPYSIVAGIKVIDGAALAPDEILLNKWAVDDLKAKVGDRIEATFYVAGAKGKLETVSRKFNLTGIVGMDNPYVNAEIVPDLEGMTDAGTMNEWDPPFPVELARIRPKDEQYWKDLDTAPKAFVSPATCRKLWLHNRPKSTDGSGWVTGIRLRPLDAKDMTTAVELFTRNLLRELPPRQAGLIFRALKAEALVSARATQDFSVLFLAMSMFLVASAVGLIVLMLRLTIERRAGQIGIMLAVGFKPKTVRRTLTVEAFMVALSAALVGIPLGIAYAGGIIAALGAFWSGAVGSFPLQLHVTTRAVTLGALAGLVVSLAAVRLSVRRLGRAGTVELLGGGRALAAQPPRRCRRTLNIAGALLVLVAAVLPALSVWLSLVPTQVAFFIGAAACMTGVLMLLGGQLQRRARDEAKPTRPTTLRLALMGASRHRLRSLLTAGLLACASLIIVTVATFGRDPSRVHPGPKNSGTGGFNLVVRTDLPIFPDLNSETGRKELGFGTEASEKLSDAKIFALRTSDGQDISCLNTQRAAVPRLLGVPDKMIRRGGFTFSAHERFNTDEPKQNPWGLLKQRLPDGAIPAFADAATAKWNLHKELGQDIEVPTPTGSTVKLRLVGLLGESIFAGELLIAEDAFARHFGGEVGCRTFLLETGPDSRVEESVTKTLREELNDFGVDVVRTSDLLASFAQVQNTYLLTFQTLGGLGLLLGTFGLVTVLFRNVLERRGELAMMLAVGFTRRRLMGMVVLENVLLLVVGVATGTLAALVGAAPQLLTTQSDVRWGPLAVTLLLTIAVGTVGCAAAARASMSGNLIEALRSE